MIQPSAYSNREVAMTDALSASEIDDRIAILRDNIRQLVEQAAAQSGAGDDARISDRIAEQTRELEQLLEVREALTKSK
jgi:uncharacterized small protein (DUF1192 family)